MGIDRVGKSGGAPTPASGAEDASKATGVSKSFEAHVEDAAGKSVERARGAASTPLERLRAGEVDVHGYIDLKVEEATAHLQGLNATELDAVRKMLREELAGDPGLAELVRRATGQLPASNE